MKWVKMNRDLKKGDILRCKVENKDHHKFGQFVYSVCSGVGFGCSMNTLGNAIFVDHEGFDLDMVLKKRNEPSEDKTSNRWERFWDIEVMEE